MNRFPSLIAVLALAAALACGGGGGGSATPPPPPVAPVITVQPSAFLTGTVPDPFTFRVTATGTAPLAYQWLKEGLPIPGATASQYAVAVSTLAHAGQYSVAVSNAAGSVTSATCTLTLAPSMTITAQPASQTSYVGDPVTLSVTVEGRQTTAYRWRKNGVDIPGATAAAYAIPSVALGDAGTYTVVASNAYETLISAPAVLTVEATFPAALATWPNAASSANSDPWIARNHRHLVRMRPRFLVVNFANGIGAGGNDNIDDGPLPPALIQAKAQAFVDALREASRHQPSLHPSAEPFLEPEIVKIVNLQDANGHANSDLFPRGAVNPSDGYPVVGYYKLFSSAYAPLWGFLEGGRYLTLGELVDRGLVHEVIMMANQVDGRAPNPPGQVTRNILEVAFTAQAYDENLVPRAGEFVKNGIGYTRQKVDMANATFEDHNSMPWTGRSLRIYFMNASRGAGCLLHSLGHEFEFRYNESRIYAPGKAYDGTTPNPYLQPLFRRYADFDMRAKYGVGFDSLYAGGDNYAYADCGGSACATLNVQAPGTPASIPNYRPVAGNVHYPPGAAHGYDYEPASPVRASVESFAQPGETAVPFGRAKWDYITSNPALDGDCGGKFLVYWYQNMPGFQNAARDLLGRPMLNWWPFMYY